MKFGPMITGADILKMKLELPEVIDVTKGNWCLENTFADKNDWHLTQSKEDEGDYWFPISKTFDIIKALEHIGAKAWVDRIRLLDGLMPAIRFFSYNGRTE